MKEKEFKNLAHKGYNRVPLVLEMFADLDTPLSVYLKTANSPYSYLLESVEGGERFGRYSFIGLSARTRFYVFGKRCVEMRDDVIISESNLEDPLDWVRGVQERYVAYPRPDLPRFLGGLVGCFGYEIVKYIEKKLDTADKPDCLKTPDILLLLSEELVVVDNLSGRLFVVVYADPREDKSWASAQKRLKEINKMLEQPVVVPLENHGELPSTHTEFAKPDFMAAVAKAKEFIAAGDIMQVVVSQRMHVSFEAEPLALYRSLRALNPSPYMFFFNMGDFQVIGSSPEILVRLEDGLVTLRPIAGTRPRGDTLEKDGKYETDLLSDPKELAEHLMLLDLGRNDVGRVAKIGTVSVTEQMIVERYSHVMHIVSNVQGELNDDLDAIAVLKASFPAGTVSGAPKVRAMEIIQELEPSKRGVYSGAVGYIGFGGDMDVAIAIRTAVIKDQVLYVQAGAGIVADSVPELEWMETHNKAKAIIKAAEMATRGGRHKKS